MSNKPTVCIDGMTNISSITSINDHELEFGIQLPSTATFIQEKYGACYAFVDLYLGCPAGYQLVVEAREDNEEYTKAVQTMLRNKNILTRQTITGGVAIGSHERKTDASGIVLEKISIAVFAMDTDVPAQVRVCFHELPFQLKVYQSRSEPVTKPTQSTNIPSTRPTRKDEQTIKKNEKTSVVPGGLKRKHEKYDS